MLTLLGQVGLVLVALAGVSLSVCVSIKVTDGTMCWCFTEPALRPKHGRVWALLLATPISGLVAMAALFVVGLVMLAFGQEPI
jgi:hypothetical protein